MSRLLFAAGRGALVQSFVQIQTKCMCIHCGGKNAFDSEERVELTDTMLLAVHPDDEAMQYGPISTKLRESAATKDMYPATFLTTVAAPHGSWWMRVDDTNDFYKGDELTRSLFLLILSEALADEGL